VISASPLVAHSCRLFSSPRINPRPSSGMRSRSCTVQCPSPFREPGQLEKSALLDSVDSSLPPPPLDAAVLPPPPQRSLSRLLTAFDLPIPFTISPRVKETFFGKHLRSPTLIRRYLKVSGAFPLRVSRTARLRPPPSFSYPEFRPCPPSSEPRTAKLHVHPATIPPAI